ncbi:MAG: hypothetical protein ACRDD1_16600, partial [Planctomycetia bacterium]
MHTLRKNPKGRSRILGAGGVVAAVVALGGLLPADEPAKTAVPPKLVAAGPTTDAVESETASGDDDPHAMECRRGGAPFDFDEPSTDAAEPTDVDFTVDWVEEPACLWSDAARGWLLGWSSTMDCGVGCCGIEFSHKTADATEADGGAGTVDAAPVDAAPVDAAP